MIIGDAVHSAGWNFRRFLVDDDGHQWSDQTSERKDTRGNDSSFGSDILTG